MVVWERELTMWSHLDTYRINRDDDKNEWMNDEMMIWIEEEASDEKTDPLSDLKKIGSFMKSFSNKDSTEMTIEESRMNIPWLDRLQADKQ